MVTDTVELLKECDVGCKCATNSMEQVKPFLKEGNLKKVIEYYDKEHIQLGEKCHEMLDRLGEEERDPSGMAKVFSWVSTEIKMLCNDEEKKIADLMVDGCNMGIKSLTKYLNQYQEADPESRDLAIKLIHLEQHFRDELLGYL